MNNTYYCGTIYGAINCLKHCNDITNCYPPEILCFYSPDYCKIINSSAKSNINILLNFCGFLLTFFYS